MDPVTTLKFAIYGHLWIAPNTDPHDREFPKRISESSLRPSSIEEDLIEDHPDSRSCYRRYAISPGGLGPAKRVADSDRAIGTEAQRATG